ncbi:MAG: hypothetical protein HOO96_20445, partial [Polyangiaceae bacterium]|nr:hypothetical protein [Polyangiaceae bacterium]
MKRENEDSGLVDLDALIRTMNEDAERARRAQSARPLKLEPRTVPQRLPRTPKRPRLRRIAVAVVALASLGGNAFALAKVAARVLEERATATEGATPPRTALGTAAPAPLLPPVMAVTADAIPPPPTPLPSASVTARPVSARAPMASAAPREPEIPVALAPAAESTAAPKIDLSHSEGGASLMEAMRLAAGPSAETRAMPAPVFSRVEPEAKQLHPAPGALVAAIANVQDGARRCLEPGDAPRACTVVFRSSGDVARVDVPGGDPKSECIRASLARARLDAFSEP